LLATSRLPSGGFRNDPDRADAVVDLNSISVSVERTPVLRHLSLTVTTGQAVGVVGANGSGKSTLLALLSTLLPPTGGTGRVLGAALGSRECESVRRRIALIGHSAALYPRLTLAENLHFFCRLAGVDTTVADAALESVGLGRAAGRPAERCSHGMRRRAELARVILGAPSLLLLDEAHAGLDAASAGLVDTVVDDVCQRGGAAVVISHERDRLRSAVHRIEELREGRLTALASPVPATVAIGAP
jgi:heme exporter protein A